MKIQYLNSSKGFDKKIGSTVIKDGIYEVSEELAKRLEASGNYKIVRDEVPKIEVKKKDKSKIIEDIDNV